MRIKGKTVLLYTLILLCVITMSCTTKTVYHHYNIIDGGNWSKTDTAYFVLPDSMAEGEYNTNIGVRHTVNYPYRDLWLSVKYPYKNVPDTIHLYLANERGNWNGSGTASGYYQFETDGPTFYYSGHSDSVIKVCHIMKDLNLSSITDIGIRISKK